MRSYILSLIVVLACLGPAFAGDWTVVKFQGRDYLTLENVATFYDLGVVHRNGMAVSMSNGSRSLRGTLGSGEFYINNLKFNLSYPLEEAGGEMLISRMDLTKVIEPVLRPSHIKGAELVDTVVLDPGHGGYDNGATSVFGNEKTFALDVALRTRDLLQQMGFKVYMTRSSDVFIPLEDRVRYANQFSNALFISIHFNSGESDASGLETYTLAPRGVPSMAADGPRLSDFDPCPGNVCDAENMALATATHSSMVYRSQMFDRGIKRARFVVIRDITIPGVLVEGGFLSNPDDARKIATTAYRQQEAVCIANAVRNYRLAVGAPAQLGLDTGGPRAASPAVVVNTTGADGRVPPRRDQNEPVVATPTAN